jgi:hypothetical protein
MFLSHLAQLQKALRQICEPATYDCLATLTYILGFGQYFRISIHNGYGMLVMGC